MVLLICSGCSRTVSDSKIASGYTDSVLPIKGDSLDIDSTLIPDNEIDYVSLFDSSSAVTEDSLIEVYGIVQSSGIREFDNHDIEAEYQVETLKNSFFLLTQMDLDNYWGKRVKVIGSLAEGWTLDWNRNPTNTFGRIPLIVDSISEISNDSIFNYRNIHVENNYYDHRTTLSGYIIRRKRISSDISMDYSLALDQPIMHPEDSSTMLESIDIFPAIDFDTLNRIIDQQHHISTSGYISGGYAEGIIFKTDSITIWR